MNPTEVEKIFSDSGALLAGHFLLSSGNHSDRYLQCALVTQHPEYAAVLADALAGHYQQQAIDVVLGPAVGGIVIAQEVAQALWRQGHKQVRAIFCERVEGQMRLRRGFQLKPGERVLAVEDVITTGGSVKEAITLAQTYQVDIAGIGTFIDRSPAEPELGAPLTSLLKVKANIYLPAECPLCQAGSTPVKPGSRGLI